MPDFVRKSLRDKTIHNVLLSELSETDKDCVLDVFVRYEHMLDRNHLKHGRWQITAGSLFPANKCSVCNLPSIFGQSNYCPNCGAKMDLKEGESK